MPKTAKADPAAKGIYLRKKSYWLRYSHNGEQLRVPLHTREFTAAVEAAKKIRGVAKEAIIPKIKPGETPTWKQAIDRYIADKLAGKKDGQKVRKFRPGTATRTADILRAFGEWSESRGPFDITTPTLQKFYDERKKRSVASARTIVDRVCCFLSHLGHVIAKPHYDEDDEKEVRDVVVAPKVYAELIESCSRNSTKFVFYAGFHAGMRRNEIVHCRPQWIRLDAQIPHIKVPGKETQRLANGTTYQWRSKNGKDRSIPLSADFTVWLRENLDANALFVLKPEACSKRYRFDPRTSFENHVADYISKHPEQENFGMHAMRHSYITHLCNSGNPNITIMKVSAWSGDKIETIERHYWKKNVDADGLDDVLAGKKTVSTGTTLEEILLKVSQGKLSPKAAKKFWIVSEEDAKRWPDLKAGEVRIRSETLP
jgi:integrase